MNNRQIRAMMEKDDIYLWQIAKVLSIHETTLVKRFRNELSQEQLQQVLSAVEAIKLDRLKHK